MPNPPLVKASRMPWEPVATSRKKNAVEDFVARSR